MEKNVLDLATIDAAIAEAQTAAAAATQKYLDDFPDQWYPCGFAWVNIKPARGKFVNRLKELNIGRTDEYYGGYTVYNPSGNATQCMDAKKAGADAFAEVMRKNGLKCNVCTRWD